MELLTRILDQLRDPLAIGLATSAAALTFAFAQPLPVALVVGGTVLLVRVAAGLLNPTVPPPPIPPPTVLTDGISRSRHSSVCDSMTTRSRHGAG